MRKKKLPHWRANKHAVQVWLTPDDYAFFRQAAKADGRKLAPFILHYAKIGARQLENSHALSIDNA